MDKPILHVFTVRGRPHALDVKGAVHAIELGYFPVSSTGYYSVEYWTDKPPALTEELISRIQKNLEGKAKERDKEIKSAERDGLTAVRKNYIDPISICIQLSMAFDRVAGQAFFVDEEEQKKLLHLAQRLADKLAAMPCPESPLSHPAWTVERVKKHISRAARQGDHVRQALREGHMLALAEDPDPIAGGRRYADLFRKKTDGAPIASAGSPDSAYVVASRRLRKAYLICREQYFIWQGHYKHAAHLSAWGMTENIDEAFRFSSLKEAIDYWRSRHTFPENYEHCIWDGYLTFFEESKKGLRRVMPIPPQQELF